MPTIAMTAPTDYTAESAAIERKRKLAEALQMQAYQPLESTGTAGGAPIPISPYAGLAKMLNAYSGAEGVRTADQETKALAARSQGDLIRALTESGELGRDRPATPEGTVGDPLYEGEMTIAAQPERKADKLRAALRLMEHPDLRQLGAAQYQSEIGMQGLEGLMGQGATPPPQAAPQAPQSTAQSLAEGLNPPPAAPPAAPLGVPPVRLLGVPGGKEIWSELAQRSRPTDLQRNYAAAGLPVDASAVNPRLAAAQYDSRNRLAEWTIPGTDRKIQTTQAILNAITTGNAPDHDTALAASELMKRNGLIVNIGVGHVANPTLHGLPMGSGGATPAPINPMGESERAAKTTYSQERSKAWAKIADEMRETWNSANNKNMMIDRLDILMADPNITSGTLAEAISDLKGIANSLGINIAGKPAEDAIRAISNEFALELRNPRGGAGMPGAMSDADRRFLAQIPPGLSQSREGRQLIMLGMRALNTRHQQVAEMATEYENTHGRLDNGFDQKMRAWSKQTPLFQPAQQAAMQELIRRTK